VDIARALQITPATVSRALNNHPAISPATKLAVQNTAKQLHYSQNRVASSLRLGYTNILGVIIPSAEVSFFASVIHGIEKTASLHGYSILIYQSNEDPEQEARGVETFLRSRVDGIMASMAKGTKTYDHFLEIRKKGVPLILFDRANHSLGTPSVVVDDYGGAYRAVEHLLQQGYRKIAHIGGPPHIEIFHDRLRGYTDALRAYGLPVRKEWIVRGKVSVESGRECTARLMQGKERPDAILAVEDFTALGAIQVLKEKGVDIPGEVGIIGFANEPFGLYITPSLSTVDQQPKKMGEKAAKLFFDLSTESTFYQKDPKKLVLEPKIICRASSLKSGSMESVISVDDH
jgi:LacI family transcriptional regulator